MNSKKSSLCLVIAAWSLLSYLCWGYKERDHGREGARFAFTKHRDKSVFLTSLLFFTSPLLHTKPKKICHCFRSKEKQAQLPRAKQRTGLRSPLLFWLELFRLENSEARSPELYKCQNHLRGK